MADYTIDKVTISFVKEKMQVVYENDAAKSAKVVYNMYANVLFTYKHLQYKIPVLVTEISEATYDVDTGYMSDYTVSKDPSTVTKSDIDKAVSDGIDTRIAIIDLENEFSATEYKCQSLQYPYPIEGV